METRKALAFFRVEHLPGSVFLRAPLRLCDLCVEME
jgi:hypothetical protein